jgi:hypothetical protein
MYDYSSEDEEISQYCCSTKNIIKELCAYDPVSTKDDQNLVHNCYLKMVQDDITDADIIFLLS